MKIQLILLIIFGASTYGIKFSWESCGSSTDPIKVVDLDVSQNASRTLYVSGRGKTAVNVTSPIKGEIEMKKKMFWGWTRIPCMDGFGSCTYEDVCALSPYKSECPKQFTDNNLPCRCPILVGQYAAKKFPVDLSILPKFLEDGRYLLKGVLTANGKELICLNVDITIGSDLFRLNH